LTTVSLHKNLERMFWTWLFVWDPKKNKKLDTRWQSNSLIKMKGNKL